MADASIPNAPDSCKTCRFMRADDAVMTCRRYPPTVHSIVGSRQFHTNSFGLSGWTDSYNDVSLWPVVVDEAWCGEHEARG